MVEHAKTDIELVTTKRNLANAYGSVGHYEKQVELLKEVLNTEVAHYKTEDLIEVATTKHNFANAYGSMGDYEKQLELLKEVLNTLRRLHIS